MVLLTLVLHCRCESLSPTITCSLVGDSRHMAVEDLLAVGPVQEHTLFMSRDQFDLVVVYDQSSQTLDASTTPAPSGSPTFFATAAASTRNKSPLSVLIDMIYPSVGRGANNPFRPKLKNAPVLLVGGIEAWKRHMGDMRIAKSETGGLSERGSSTRSTPFANTPVQLLLVSPAFPSLAFMSSGDDSSSPSSPAVDGYQYRVGSPINGKMDSPLSRYGGSYARLGCRY